MNCHQHYIYDDGFLKQLQCIDGFVDNFPRVAKTAKKGRGIKG